MLLICIYLMTNDVEHLCMCLLVFCISSSEKCLFGSFAHFYIELFIFLLWSHKHSLHIPDTSPLPHVWLANIFSHSVDCLFTFLLLSFVAQKSLIFYEVQFIYFLFCPLCFLNLSLFLFSSLLLNLPAHHSQTVPHALIFSYSF